MESNDKLKMIKLEIDLIISAIIAEYKSPFTFKFAVKQHNLSIETEKAYKYASGRKEIAVEEPFKFTNYLTVDTEKGSIKEKIIKYYLLVLTSKGYKPATSGEINFGNINLEENSSLVLDFNKHSLNYLKIKLRIEPVHMELIDYKPELESQDSFKYLNSGGISSDLNTTVDQSFSNLTLNQTMNFQSTLPSMNTMNTQKPQPGPVKVAAPVNSVQIEKPNIENSKDKEEISKLTKDLSNCKHELVSANEKNNKQDKLIAKYLKEISELKNMNSELNKKAASSQSMTSDSEKEVAELKRKYESEIESLKLNIKEQKRETDEVKIALSDSNSKVMDLQGKIDDLNNDLSLSKQKLKNSDFNEQQMRESLMASTNNDDLKEELQEKMNIIEQLKETNNSHQVEINQLKSIVKDLRNEKTKLYNEKIAAVKKSTDEINELKEELERIRNEKETIKEEATNRENNINNLSSVNSELQGKYNKLNEELSQLKETNKNLEGTLYMANANIQNMSGQIKELQNQLSERKTEISVYKETAENLSKQVSDLQEDNRKIILLTEENNRLKHQISQIGMESEIAKSSIDGEVSNLQLKIGELEMDKNLLNKRIEDYNIQIAKLRDEIDSQSIQIQSYNQDKEYVIENNSLLEKKFKEELVIFKEKLEDKNREIDALNDTNQNLNIEIDRLNKAVLEIRQNSNANENLLLQMDLMKDKFEVRENELKVSNEIQVEKLQNEIKSLKEKLRDLDNQNELEYQLNKLKAENGILRQEVNNLRQEETNNDDLKSIISRSEVRINELESQLLSTKSDLTNLKEKYSNVNEELQINRVKMNQKEETILGLEKEIMDNKEKIGELLNEISDLEQNVLKTESANKETKNITKWEKLKKIF